MLGQMLNLPCSNLQKTMMVRVSWGERRILQARLKIYWGRFGTGRTTDKETTVNTTGKVRLKTGKDTVQMALKERTHSTNVQVQGRKVKLYNTCFIWGSILDWIYIYIYLWRSYTSRDSLGCFGFPFQCLGRVLVLTALNVLPGSVCRIVLFFHLLDPFIMLIAFMFHLKCLFL